MPSHGDTNVTVGAGSLPNVGAMTRNAAKANDARFTLIRYGFVRSVVREQTVLEPPKLF